MTYKRGRHDRQLIRLSGYDYAALGAYFVTLCTRQRRLFFHIPEIFQIADRCWRAIPAHTPSAELDEWVSMPNHVHGRIFIHADDDRGRGVQLNAPTSSIIDASTPSIAPRRDANNKLSMMSPRPSALSVIGRTYNAAVTTAGRAAGQPEFAWQRGYYDHIVRSPRELDGLRRYIRDDPLKWSLDRDNPQNASRLSPPASARGLEPKSCNELRNPTCLSC